MFSQSNMPRYAQPATNHSLRYTINATPSQYRPPIRVVNMEVK